MTYFAAMPTWYADPQATMCIWRTPRRASSVSPAAERSMAPSRIAEFSVSRTARGCSWISFIMKCS